MLVGAKTHLGKVRKNNQDGYLVLEKAEWQLYAVADGMGGHRSGEVASSLAIETLRDYFSCTDLREFEQNWQAYLTQVFQEANRKICNLGSKNTEHQGMGTTLTMALHKNSNLYIGHVGDSRLYLVQEGNLRKVTQDHSLVEELVRQGEITPEEAYHHPQKNILLRALGTDPAEIVVDLHKEDFPLHDFMILATDGLTNLVEDQEIRKFITSLTPEESVNELVKLANKRGGHDNITVLVVKNFAKKKTKQVAKPVRKKNPLLVMTIAVLALALSFGYYYLNNSYFLGLYQKKVAIYRGIPLTLGSFRLCRVEEKTSINQQEVSSPYQARIKEGILLSNKEEAYKLIKDITSLPRNQENKR